jgi:hypothetical protein
VHETAATTVIAPFIPAYLAEPRTADAAPDQAGLRQKKDPPQERALARPGRDITAEDPDLSGHPLDITR